jgi:flavin reductase (DIM6/NTAB) family NADH-FMN oxidoreductase RutF
MDSKTGVPDADLVNDGWRVDTEPDIRPIMATFPTGVSVVTTLDHGRSPWGITCTSLCSVAVRPPILLVCIRGESPTLAAMLSSGAFAVNLLHSGAQSVAELFASGARDRFHRIVWDMRDGDGGPHLDCAAHAIADCTVMADTLAGDHTIVTGRVHQASVTHHPRPLLYGLRRYASWPQAPSPRLDGPQ